MTDNRNTILAVILSGLVLIGWQYFFNMPQMEKRRAAEQAQSELQSAIQQWDNGSGGAPAIGIAAPAGISFATPKTIVSYAAVNIDSVAQRHLQMTAGQRCNVNAGKGISLFAQREGLTAIANYGKVLVQSQHDSTQIDAAL